MAFDSIRKTRILRFLNTYSHATLDAEAGHDPHALAETQDVMRDILDLIEAADPDHFAGLKKLVTSCDIDD